jgi:hypothetical protein
MFKKIPVFGFDNLLADWVFLRLAQYFGDDDARNLTSYDLSPEYFEIIVDRDPLFVSTIYPALSTSISLYAGMPEKSVALMNQSLKSMSPQMPAKSYYVWRNKAIDELLFLGDSQASQKSFAMSAEWAATHPDAESQIVAEASQQTAQFLSRNPDSRWAQISAWSSILNYAVDQKTRNLAVSKIEALGGKIKVNAEGQFQVIFSEKD